MNFAKRSDFDCKLLMGTILEITTNYDGSTKHNVYMYLLTYGVYILGYQTPSDQCLTVFSYTEQPRLASDRLSRGLLYLARDSTLAKLTCGVLIPRACPPPCSARARARARGWCRSDDGRSARPSEMSSRVASKISVAYRDCFVYGQLV